MLRQWGAEPKTFPIVPDKKEALRAALAEALAEEAVTVTDIALAPAEQDRTRLTVQLEYQGTDLSVSLVI